MDENTGLYMTRRRVNTYDYMYRVFQEESAMIHEKVPWGKLRKYNQTYLLNIRSSMLTDAMARVF
jgi:hypothetical protein